VAVGCRKNTKSVPYDASAVGVGIALRGPPVTITVWPQRKTQPVRCQRGYSAEIYISSAAASPKTLRPQFGEKYDRKKVRNSWAEFHRGSFPTNGHSDEHSHSA